MTSLERGPVPCPRDPQSLHPLSFRELGEGGVTLPWTTWGCLLCWMNHSGDCFSQTVCGPGKPPSQSEIRSESLVICPLSSTASLQSESSFHFLAYTVSPRLSATDQHRLRRLGILQSRATLMVGAQPGRAWCWHQSPPPCSRVSGCQPV